VGSLCAIAHAQKGARVALFEAKPGAQTGLKGEWLHPPALRMLEQIGINFDTQTHATKGFVVFPEDGSSSIPLDYPDESHGLVYPHETLVARLREAAINEPNVHFIPQRVRPNEDGHITFTENGVEASVSADQIVGADGRGSLVLRFLGLTAKPTVVSRMVGVKLNGVTLPMEGYGHIFCGGPGPIFTYRLGDDNVTAIMDVPREYSGDQTTALLLDSYAPWFPADIRPMFVEAVHEGNFRFAGNTVRPRISYGNSRFVVIGDAAGHYHPMTAVGLTLGFGDATALAESENFDAFVARRFREIRAPEMLAMGFYEVFADHRDEVTALRHAVYRLWRNGGRIAARSVRLLACEDTSEASLGFVGAFVVALAVARTIPVSIHPRAWHRAGRTVQQLVLRIGWFMWAVRQLRKSRARGDMQNKVFHDSLARAFLLSETPTSNRFRQPPA
jgi:2-polyprenyl-6-methoxyphenol hydroxylase-like FAD-dependent oxidoreductase